MFQQYDGVIEGGAIGNRRLHDSANRGQVSNSMARIGKILAEI